MSNKMLIFEISSNLFILSLDIMIGFQIFFFLVVLQMITLFLIYHICHTLLILSDLSFSPFL